MILFLPVDFPKGLDPWYYVVGANQTHVALALGYGLIANHHKSINTEYNWADSTHRNIEFMVRRLFGDHIARC